MVRGPSSYRVRREEFVVRLVHVTAPRSEDRFWAWVARRIERRRARIAIERWAGRR